MYTYILFFLHFDNIYIYLYLKHFNLKMKKSGSGNVVVSNWCRHDLPLYLVEASSRSAIYPSDYVPRVPAFRLYMPEKGGKKNIFIIIITFYLYFKCRLYIYKL